MSTSPILTYGFGSYGTVNLVPTHGFGTAVVVSVTGLEVDAGEDRIELTAKPYAIHIESGPRFTLVARQQRLHVEATGRITPQATRED